MNRLEKTKRKIRGKQLRKTAVIATLSTMLIAPTVLAATNGTNSYEPNSSVKATEQTASFTWNDDADKWTHGDLGSAKTVTIGNAKIGIYSQQDGVLTVAAGDAQYDNSYMASPMATIPVVEGTTQYATINLADTGSELTGTVTVAVTFAKGETPTPDKPQAPSNITFNDAGDFVTAWVGANTSTSVYDASGNKIDDGSMYMQTEGQAQLDLVRPLTKGEQIYVVSINPDTQVESDKTWATFMPVTAKTAVTVMGMDRDSGETLWSTVQELDSDMTHTLTSQAVEGYELVSPASEDVYVTGDSMTHVFYYVKKAVVPEDKFSTVTIQYVDSETGQSIAPQTTISDVKVGTDYVGNAIAIDGYTLSDDASKTINVVEDANSNVISFRYTKDAPIVEKANVTVKYVDENGKSIADDKVVKDLEVGTKHTEKAITIDGYELTSEAEKTVDVQSGGSEIAFTYKVKEVNPPVVEKGNLTVKYVDESGKELATPKVVKDLEVGKSHTEVALAIKGYELVGSDTEEKEMVIKKGENTMTFTYKQVKEVVANAENVEFLNGKQMTAVIPKGLTMYVVYKGEVIGKAENQKSFFNRAMFADFDPTLEPTTLNLTKEVAKGDTVQYYTENAEGEKSETLEITRPEDVNPPIVPEPEQPVDPTHPTDPEKPTDNGDGNGNGNGNVVTDTEGTTDTTTTTDTNKETTKEDSKEKETTKDSKEDKKLPDTGSKVMNSAILTSSGLVLVLGVLIMFKKRFKKSK
ncbi:serine-aspartate repeat-containing protein C/D/E [Enterococcus sp. DIV1614a]|uniref:MucBP domain-containing protein n=1 Tax=Enterococcus sp. DIV1614a TaxID=2774817 RepID=UPI003F28E859